MQIAIIGMGSMGPGMAGRIARAGHSVAVFDTAPAAVERALSMQPIIQAAMDGLNIADRAGDFSVADTLEQAVTNAELVIENVPEDIEIKASVYRQIDQIVPDTTLVASDTSGIPITNLQRHITNPARFVGMHWSNPPHIIPMIEVIAGEATSKETVTAIQTLISDMDLLPVTLKKDVPGFVENRVLYALLRECVDLVENGVVDSADLDTCVKWGIGYKLAVVGPMRLLDMAGLDIYQSVASFLNAELCSRADVSEMVTKNTEKGRLGMKSGGGLFDYSEDELEALPAARGRKLVAVRNVLEGK